MDDLSDFAAEMRGLMEEAGGAIAAGDRQDVIFSDSRFNGLALRLFALQFASNAPLRQYCASLGRTPEHVGHWSEIPAMPTAAFKDYEVTCIPRDRRTAVFHSSGTTARRPSRHFHCAESLAVYHASLWRWFSAHLGLTTDHCERAGGKANSCVQPRLVILIPSAQEAPCSSLAHMFEMVRERLRGSELSFFGSIAGDGSWKVDCDTAVVAFRQAMAAQTPVLVLGTAFSLVQLLDDMAAQDIQLELVPGSRVMETGGYKGRSRQLHKSELYALIQGRLGIASANIVSEYGMSELSSQAYDHSVATHGLGRGARETAHAPYASRCTLSASRVFEFPPWVRTRVVSPETGWDVQENETGLLRVYDLSNIFSSMAIQTEDLAIRRGSGFELAGRAAPAEPRGCSLMATA